MDFFRSKAIILDFAFLDLAAKHCSFSLAKPFFACRQEKGKTSAFRNGAEIVSTAGY
jgi:hypothetical protein